MSDGSTREYECLLCDGQLSLPEKFNGIRTGRTSFSRRWHCEECGVEYTEQVDIEQTQSDVDAVDQGGVPDTDEDPEGSPVVDSQGSEKPRVGPPSSDVTGKDELSTNIDWRPFNRESGSQERNTEFLDEWRARQEERERAEKESKERRVREEAGQFEVEWEATVGRVVGQMDEFVVTEGVSRNSLLIVNKSTGDLAAELILERSEQPEEPVDDSVGELNIGFDLPNEVDLRPTGILKLTERPGWYIHEGIHYVVTRDSVVTVDDRGVSRYTGIESGPEWTLPGESIGVDSQSVRHCSVHDGWVLVATDTRLTCWRLVDGEVEWSEKMHTLGAESQHFAYHDQSVFVGGDSQVVAVDLTDGSEVWQTGLGDEYRDQRLRNLFGVVAGVLVSVEESDTEYVCGYDLDTGERLWQYQDRGYRIKIVRAHEGSLYLDVNNGVTIAVDAATGVVKWKHQFKRYERAQYGPHDGDYEWIVYDTGNESVHPLGEHVIICSWLGSIACLKMETGELEWFVSPEYPDWGPECGYGIIGDVVVRIKDTTVDAFDVSTGDERWSFETLDMVQSDVEWGKPRIMPGAMYFTDVQGTLYEVDGGEHAPSRVFLLEDGRERTVEVDEKRLYLATVRPAGEIPVSESDETVTDSPLHQGGQQLLELVALRR